jgi:stearoyl-CoA desaturase (delta-9 desaturase)
MGIVIFFIAHWIFSVFCQSFYLHRYGAHRMFAMNKGWERFFHFLTYCAQGASYLNPRGYALLHRLHHAYSDTPKDPHSPANYSSLWTMMWATKERYDALTRHKERLDTRFEGGYPEWPLLDKIGTNPLNSILWIAFYIAIYATFATAWWQWLLLPFQCLMGPIHGAIVNWCGHRYGYRNFKVSDDSRNTLPFDFVTMGELFQNNHHRYCARANFAVKWFEVDPTFVVMRVLAALRIIRIESDEIPYESSNSKELNWGISAPNVTQKV